MRHVSGRIDFGCVSMSACVSQIYDFSVRIALPLHWCRNL